MVYIIEKKYTNQGMNIELTSYIDNKQNIWFRGKDVATILGYSDTDQARRKNVSKNHKMIHLLYPKCCPVVWTGQQNTSIIGVDVLPPQQNDTRGKYYTFINEAGFYELVFSSKLEAAKNSVIGYSTRSSHQSVNMANANYLIVPEIK